jgi:hypothetical protein
MPQTDPSIDRGSLHWRSGALKIDSEWQADAPAIRETAFASDDGLIEWQCFMPRARAHIGNRIGSVTPHVADLIYSQLLTVYMLRDGPLI